MAEKRELKTMIAQAVAAVGFEFVGCEVVKSGRSQIVRVYIDKPEGVTVDDCAMASKQIGSVLDAEQCMASQYNLEVSSPGLNRPLFELSQYKDFIGQTVHVKSRLAINGQRNFTGILRNVDESNVVLSVHDEEVSLPFASISKGNLVAA